jgi:hypothetical protein
MIASIVGGICIKVGVTMSIVEVIWCNDESYIQNPNLYVYIFVQHPPAVEAAPVTQRLDLKLSKVEVGRPFVITSANC